MDRAKDYISKCHVMRQIMSNKARKFRYINALQNIAMVVVSSFLTFIGFSGIDKIQTYLKWLIPLDQTKIEFAFNLLVFALFVLAILHLVFQFGQKQSNAERAIIVLTNLSNQIEDLLSREEQGIITVGANEIDGIRQKYETVIQSIPANSDREYRKAKKDQQEKGMRQDVGGLTPQGLFEETQQQTTLQALVSKSSQTMQILRSLRQIDPNIYLAGGLVRNLVWDYLHGYSSPTPVDDVDVVYFDKLSSQKEHDLKLEDRLRNVISNLQWSVRNQARMHSFSSDEPYDSLEDAISKWPETATSIAVRLNKHGELDFIYPHGLSDLFRLLVRPTPNFAQRTKRIRERMAQKHWEKTWPKLKFFLPPIL